jgi:hypothetical protein
MTTTNTPRPAPVSFNIEELLALLTQKRHDEISQKFLAVLEQFRAVTYFGISPEDQYFIDQFVKVFLFVVSEPTFVISERLFEQFLAYNHVICNIVAISSTRNTDAYLKIVARQPNNIVRLLVLYNARNEMKVDRKAIFDLNPTVASIWFAHYACSYYGALISQVGWENLREHFQFTHPQLRIAHQIQETYFGSTYAGPDCDRRIKPVVNRTVQEHLTPAKIRRVKTDPRKIAVLSAFWLSGTSVYRIFSAMIRALKPDFHLTFVQLSENPPPETDLWDDVRKMGSPGALFSAEALQNNDFQVVHFPDIGMSDSSILLANRRIAPIQLCAPGHPNSTFGSEIDYFMSGEEIEPPDHPEQNYSERLVIMPGLGQVHTRPRYEVQGLKQQNPVCLVNLPAWCQKLNYPYVQTLKKIQAAARGKFKVRLFSGNSLSRCNDYIPFAVELADQLGRENLEVVPNLPYAAYMAEMEKGDLALDAFHFGGGNTVSDNLFIGVPMICWEGDQWYNRTGPAILRRATVPELIVSTEQDFIDLAVKLIDDSSYRESLREKLKSLDLDRLIYFTDDAPYLNKAIHYLIDNHEQLQGDQSREPIRIPR